MRSAIPFDIRRIDTRSRPDLAACAAALGQARGLADDVATPAAERIAALDRLAAETPDPGLRKAIQACQKAVSTPRFANWSALILYCRFATAPVVRHMQTLHRRADESPANAIWPESYCAAALILDLILDCKADYVERDRVFLPADWLRGAGVEPSALGAGRASPGLRTVIDRMLARTDEMLRDARSGARETPDRRFRRAALEGIAARYLLAAKLRRRDPLATRIELRAADRIRCAIRARLGR